jgi:hypothetical protein
LDSFKICGERGQQQQQRISQICIAHSILSVTKACWLTEDPLGSRNVCREQ